MILSEILHNRSVRARLESRKRKDVFEEMAKLIVASGLTDDAKAVRKAFESREKTGSTAVGNGVAIPHGKTSKLDRMAAAIGIAPDGLDWPTPDAEPVRIVVALAGPDGQPAEHLRALSHTARLLGKEEVRRKMVETAGASDLLQYIQGLEEAEVGRAVQVMDRAERKLVVLIVQDESYLDSILQYLIEMEVEGTTVIEGSRADQLVSMRVPLFADFLTSGGYPSQYNKIIVGMVSAEALPRLTEGVHGLLRGADRREAIVMLAVDAVSLTVLR